MQINLKIQGLDKAVGNFHHREQKMKQAVSNIISKSLLLLERYTKIESPVRTGRMRASISEGKELYPTYARIGPTVFYAKYVERRNPFMERGAKNSLPDIRNAIKDEVAAALK
jgi:hypothetical protein